MGRSVKRGPFLYSPCSKRIQEMRQSGEKAIFEDLEPRLHEFSRTSSDTPSPCTTGASTCRFMSPRIWLDISWANSASTRTFPGPCRLQEFQHRQVAA